MENIGLVIFDVAGTTAKDEGLVVKAFISAAQSQGVEEGSMAMARGRSMSSLNSLKMI